MIIVPAVPANLGAAPPSTGWTQLNLGSATIADNPNGRLFTMPDINADWSAAVEHRALSPASNYTLTAYLDTSLNLSNRSLAGVVLRQSSNSRLIIFGYEVFGTPTGDAGNRMVVRGLNSETTGNTTPAATYFRGITAATVASTKVSFGRPWLRITDDGANRSYQSSADGVDWTTHLSHTRATFATPDQVGWFRINNSDLGSDTATLRYWRLT